LEGVGKLLKRILTFATIVVLAFVLAACGGGGAAQNSGQQNGETRPFGELKEAARGSTVNFFMYGGDDAINKYVDGYVAPRLKREYGITLRRTPVDDIATVVNKLLNEKTAGDDRGTVDLVWINGENFATGADADMWFGPWAERLPNARYIAWDSPEISRDFGYPVEGREAPWGKAQFVMTYDSKKVKRAPRSAEELRSWVEEHPGRFTYPAPPDFTGNAFVEQMFYEVAGDVGRYQKPFDRAVFEERAPKVYEFFNGIEPNLWRNGETYPESSAALNNLYADGEVWLTMSYNPQEAQRQIEKGLFPESTRTYLLDGGTLANTHYVAIPFNAPNKAGAQVVANLLESPDAQREKLKPEVWGDLPALDIEELPKDERKGLESPGGPATLSTEELQENRLPEARSEWLLAIQEGWQEEVLKK
jgi:putative spermidine/putrescine transport system substrate-binding protein